MNSLQCTGNRTKQRRRYVQPKSTHVQELRQEEMFTKAAVLLAYIPPHSSRGPSEPFHLVVPQKTLRVEGKQEFPFHTIRLMNYPWFHFKIPFPFSARSSITPSMLREGSFQISLYKLLSFSSSPLTTISQQWQHVIISISKIVNSTISPLTAPASLSFATT